MKCCVKPPCEITRLAEVEENVTRRRSRESQSAVLPPISKEAKPEKAKDHHRPCGGFAVTEHQRAALRGFACIPRTCLARRQPLSAGFFGQVAFF